MTITDRGRASSCASATGRHNLEPNPRSRTASAPLLANAVRLASGTAAMIAVVSLLPVAGSPTRAVAAAVALGVAALCGFVLFRRPAASLPEDCALAAGLMVVVSLWLVADPAMRSAAERLPALVTVLALSLATLAWLCRRLSAALVLPTLVCVAATPLWGSPLAEATGNPAWVTDGLIAVSPVTHFAVAMEFDYLRTDWFYRHSAFGSLRYDYPGWPLLCLGLAALPVAGIGLQIGRALPKTRIGKSKKVTA